MRGTFMENLVCDVKKGLFSEYQNASEAYSAAILKLTRNLIGASKAEYDKLRATTEQARKRTRDAKDGLEAHTQEHGC
jgi:hypothetical protein